MKVFKDNSGISLIWVIILIVVVGVLSATLLTASNFNLRFGIDEVDTSRAFYAADAGVEYTQNSLYNLMLNDDLDILKDASGYLKDGNLYESEIESWISLSDNIDFNIEVIDNNDDDDNIVFVSTGRVNEGYEQNIEFSFDLSKGYEASVLLNLLPQDFEEDKEKYVKLRGQEKDFGMHSIAAVEMDDFWNFIHGDKEGEGYVKVAFHSDEDGKYAVGIDDYYYFDPPKSIDKVTSDEFEKENLFFTPSTETVEVGDGITGWEWEYVDYDEDKYYYEEGNVVYIINDVDEYEYYKANRNIDISPEKGVYWAETNQENEEEFDQSNPEYEKGEVIKYNEKYYEALHDMPDNPGESEFWDFVEEDEVDDYEFHSTTFNDTIIIVKGSLETTGNVEFNDSLVIVKNQATIGGKTVLNNSLILTFNHSEEEDNIFETKGTPSIGLKPLEDSISENWHGVEGLLEEIETTIVDYAFNYWRQVR